MFFLNKNQTVDTNNHNVPVFSTKAELECYSCVTDKEELQKNVMEYYTLTNQCDWCKLLFSFYEDRIIYKTAATRTNKTLDIDILPSLTT